MSGVLRIFCSFVSETSGGIRSFEAHVLYLIGRFGGCVYVGGGGYGWRELVMYSIGDFVILRLTELMKSA